MDYKEREEKDYDYGAENRMELLEQGIIEKWQRQGMAMEVGMMHSDRIPIEMERRRRQLNMEKDGK